MSGDFRKFPELRCYDDVASPQPGQHGTYWTPPALCASDLMSPMACCCTPRRVSLAMAKGDSANDEDGAQDRSDFTRESFGSFL